MTNDELFMQEYRYKRRELGIIQVNKGEHVGVFLPGKDSYLDGEYQLVELDGQICLMLLSRLSDTTGQETKFVLSIEYS